MVGFLWYDKLFEWAGEDDGEDDEEGGGESGIFIPSHITHIPDDRRPIPAAWETNYCTVFAGSTLGMG